MESLSFQKKMMNHKLSNFKVGSNTMTGSIKIKKLLKKAGRVEAS
jgi:hypothetical protein